MFRHVRTGTRLTTVSLPKSLPKSLPHCILRPQGNVSKGPQEKRLKPVSRSILLIAITSAVIFFIWALVDEDGFLALDYINLPFHELGHMLFGIFGHTFALWGGTIGQLLMPALLFLVFWRKKETLGIAFALFWFGENLLNISNYIADAQVMLLPFFGSGEHDWHAILSQLKALRLSLLIGTMVRIAGWTIMACAVGWLTMMGLRRRPPEG